MKKLKLSLKVIALFSGAMLISLIPDLFPNFFGDWLCNGNGDNYYSGRGTRCDVCSYHAPTWHWGYRHWLFFVMGVALFVIQAIDIVNGFSEVSGTKTE